MNKKKTIQKILLFTDNDTAYFKTELGTFKKIVQLLAKMSPFKIETINIANAPDLARQYKIEASPTLIAKDWRFIGEPDPEEFVSTIEEII